MIVIKRGKICHQNNNKLIYENSCLILYLMLPPKFGIFCISILKVCIIFQALKDFFNYYLT